MCHSPTLALARSWSVDQSSRVSRRLQPGDRTRNALDATSLFGLSGVTKHVQLGFSLLPLLLPHERDPTLSDKGSHSSYRSGLFAGRKKKKNVCSFYQSSSVCVLWCIVQTLWKPFASPVENTKCFVFLSTFVCAEKVILPLNSLWVNVAARDVESLTSSVSSLVCFHLRVSVFYFLCMSSSFCFLPHSSPLSPTSYPVHHCQTQ